MIIPVPVFIHRLTEHVLKQNSGLLTHRNLSFEAYHIALSLGQTL